MPKVAKKVSGIRACIGNCGQQEHGGDNPPVLRASEATSQVLPSVLGPSL